MTTEPIPYREKPHPITQLTNGEFAMWLFIASEMMMFGGLYFVYFACRPAQMNWKVDQSVLSRKEGVFLFILLTTVNFLCTYLQRSTSHKVLFFGRGSQQDITSLKERIAFLFSIFLISQALMLKAFHFLDFFQRGFVPSKSVFFSLYYMFSALHFVHMLAGLLVLLYFIFHRQFSKMQMKVFLMYWTFVDLLWVAIFFSFY